ncbi:MAG: hypothetical protein JXA73_10380 [Acidobacteria bacterium]|nr:hypothetical protein [Acidobacteriota bacterium]
MSALFLSSLRFGLSLPGKLRVSYQSEQAVNDLRRDFAGRAQNFLELCDSEVFSRPAGVYAKLFNRAEVSRERLHSMVGRHGVEDALMELASKGVFLNIDEFKGRKPLVRSGLRMMMDASDLDRVNGPSIPFLSSGSSGKSLETPIDIPGLRLLASCIPAVLRFLESEHLPVVLYYPMPSGSGFMHLIAFSLIGKVPSAWFAQWMKSPWWRSASGMKLAALIKGCRFHGISLPTPRLADIKHPTAMAEWLIKHCPEGAVVPSFTGSAIHLVHAAKRAGIRLPPIVFLLGGEPITDRKRRTIEEEGHRVFPWYSSVETGRLAMGCLSPRRPDDMHLLEDRIACIVRPRTVDAGGEERPALLYTSLHPNSYKFLLNVETGDEAAIDTEPCGCPWEALGFRRRLFNVRSFEKLTLEGISIVADFLSEMVEEEIPSHCGGTPADYQFTEEEGPDGVTRLVLSAGPAVPLDSDRIKEIVQDLFDKKFQVAGAMVLHAASIIVRREVPTLTRSGKMLAVRSTMRGKSK